MRIQNENLSMLSRLQKAPNSYQFDRWKQQEIQHSQYLKNCKKELQPNNYGPTGFVEMMSERNMRRRSMQQPKPHSRCGVECITTMGKPQCRHLSPPQLPTIGS